MQEQKPKTAVMKILQRPRNGEPYNAWTHQGSEIATENEEKISFKDRLLHGKSFTPTTIEIPERVMAISHKDARSGPEFKSNVKQVDKKKKAKANKPSKPREMNMSQFLQIPPPPSKVKSMSNRPVQVNPPERQSKPVSTGNEANKKHTTKSVHRDDSTTATTSKKKKKKSKLKKIILRDRAEKSSAALACQEAKGNGNLKLEGNPFVLRMAVTHSSGSKVENQTPFSEHLNAHLQQKIDHVTTSLSSLSPAMILYSMYSSFLYVVFHYSNAISVSQLQSSIEDDTTTQWLDYCYFSHLFTLHSQMSPGKCWVQTRVLDITSLRRTAAETNHIEWKNLMNAEYSKFDPSVEKVHIVDQKEADTSSSSHAYLQYATLEQAKQVYNTLIEQQKVAIHLWINIQSCLSFSHSHADELDGEHYSTALQIENYIAKEEVEDKDEFQDVLSETRLELEKWGPIHECVICQECDDEDHMSVFVSQERPEMLKPGTIVVKYHTLKAAHDARQYFHQNVFGNERVVVTCLKGTLCNGITIHNMFSKEEIDHDDPDEMEELEEELLEFLSQYGSIKSMKITHDQELIQIQCTTSHEMITMIEQLQNKMYGGRNISVTMSNSDWSGILEESFFFHRSTVDMSLVEDTTHEQAQASSGTNIEHSAAQAQADDPALGLLVFSLVQKLYGFQERARLKDPLKAKKLRRLVNGLREVQRGLKCGHLMCLIVAPNVQACAATGGLDESIHNIIQEARRQDLPVIFALSRRKLGKAMRKTIRISCIGIYNVDGANDIYKEILSMLKLVVKSSS